VDIEYCFRSDRGKVRTSNEDSCVANLNNKIFLVADGMGGHAAGEIASQIAASAVEAVLSAGEPNPDMEALLQIAVKTANTSVYETQRLKPECRGMGSTLTALTFQDNRYYVAHVGDSRAYLFRDGSLIQLTRDHSLVWPLFESGALAKDDISRHPQKNLITRSIGTHSDVEADLKNGDALEGDIFLLCSDGLTDVLSDQDILHILSTGKGNVRDLCEALVSGANAGGGPDNVTVVLVRLAPD
jgi:protein phosphatase